TQIGAPVRKQTSGRKRWRSVGHLVPIAARFLRRVDDYRTRNGTDHSSLTGPDVTTDRRAFALVLEIPIVLVYKAEFVRLLIARLVIQERAVYARARAAALILRHHAAGPRLDVRFLSGLSVRVR